MYAEFDSAVERERKGIFMKRNRFHKTLTALTFVLLPAAVVQSQGTGGHDGSSKKEMVASSDPVVVTVNGHPIGHAEIETLFVAIARDRLHGKSLTESDLVPLRRRHWSDVVSAAVNNWLLDHKIGDAGGEVSDSELAHVLDMELEFFLAISKLTRKQFDARVRDKGGVTLHELRAGRIATAFYKDSVRRDRWIAAKFPDNVKVTDEEVNETFEGKWTGRMLPAQVKVSHILIAADSDSEDGKVAARRKIEGVLVEARRPGADFAALARRYSKCASAPKGGDLGVIHRHGEVHAVFAEAAFELKIGEISEVVETPDGYHIIKLVERIEPRVGTLPLVEEVIRAGLRKRKIGALRRDHIERLKSTATIVYADNPPSK